jgi:hypothetical protein
MSVETWRCPTRRGRGPSRPAVSGQGFSVAPYSLSGVRCGQAASGGSGPQNCVADFRADTSASAKDDPGLTSPPLESRDRDYPPMGLRRAGTKCANSTRQHETPP